MDELLTFLILLAILAFWWDSASAYENAYQAAKQTCQSNGVSLLDDTLARNKISLCRHVKGYVQFCRRYQFEFSTDGELRYKGRIFLQGKTVDSIEMDVYREDVNSQ